MNQIIIFILSFIAGICLAIQAGINTQLGIALNKPILASISTSVSSVLFAAVFVIFSKELPQQQVVKEVPWYLWLAGGFFSVGGITLYFYAIPKIGIAQVISLGIFGQLIFSFFAGHYGWLNVPINPMTLRKALGLLTILIGILLINLK